MAAMHTPGAAVRDLRVYALVGGCQVNAEIVGDDRGRLAGGGQAPGGLDPVRQGELEDDRAGTEPGGPSAWVGGRSGSATCRCRAGAATRRSAGLTVLSSRPRTQLPRHMETLLCTRVACNS